MTNWVGPDDGEGGGTTLPREVGQLIRTAESAYQTRHVLPRLQRDGTFVASSDRNARPAYEVRDGRFVVDDAAWAALERRATTLLRGSYDESLADDYLAQMAEFTRENNRTSITTAAGTRVNSVEFSDIRATTGKVRARVTVWNVSAGLDAAGNVHWAAPENELMVRYEIGRDSASDDWRVVGRAWDFADGSGP